MIKIQSKFLKKFLIVIKMVSRHIDQWTRIKSRNITTHISSTDFNKGAIVIQWEMHNLFNKWWFPLKEKKRSPYTIYKN